MLFLICPFYEQLFLICQIVNGESLDGLYSVETFDNYLSKKKLWKIYRAKNYQTFHLLLDVITLESKWYRESGSVSCVLRILCCPLWLEIFNQSIIPAPGWWFMVTAFRWWLCGTELQKYCLDLATTLLLLMCGQWVVYLLRWLTNGHYFLATLRLMNFSRFSGE